MITFDCPHCGYSIKVQEGLAGRKGKCAGCGKQITVPGASGIGEPAAPTIEVPNTDSTSSHAAAVTPPPAAFDDLMADLGIGDASATVTPPPGQSAGRPALSHAGANLQPCPDCSELVSVNARLCPRCGCPIRDPAPVGIVPPWSTIGFERSLWSYLSAVIGTIGFLYFAFVFDTTVAGEYGNRIHNTGLMNDRLVGVIAFSAITIRAWFPDRLKLEKTSASTFTVPPRVIALVAIALVIALVVLVIISSLS